MKQVKTIRRTRHSFIGLTFIGFAAVCTFFLSAQIYGQNTFTNSTPIQIADASGANPGIGNPYPSVIPVSGLTGNITDINVRLNGFTHTFPDDIGLLLVSPDGSRRMVIQSDAGGGTDVNNVTYTLDDQAAARIPDGGPLTAGTFQPSSYGDDDTFPITGANPPPVDCQPAGECPHAATAGTATLNGIFGGISPNGNWRLYAVDQAALDTGSFTGGWSLIITTSAAPADAPLDFNGDGRTDYVVTRSASSTSQTTWYINYNGSGGAVSQTAQFGLGVGTPGFSTAFTDIPVPEDYDGDDKDDIAVWRPNGLGDPNRSYFFVLRSSNNTLLSAQFGRSTDDPTVVDDYDGDNRADFAVYRPGATDNSQSFWYYCASATVLPQNCGNNFVTVQWGQTRRNAQGAFTGAYVSPGDYDGDGRADFAVLQDIGGNGVFAICFNNAASNRCTAPGSTANAYRYVQWGLPQDDVAPGDYDGDGRTDFAILRFSATATNPIQYFILENDGGRQTYSYGRSSDFPVPGDYNGDGKTDIAVWRPNPDPALNFFFVRPAETSGANDIGYEWGQQGDFPVAVYNVH